MDKETELPVSGLLQIHYSHLYPISKFSLPWISNALCHLCYYCKSLLMCCLNLYTYHLICVSMSISPETFIFCVSASEFWGLIPIPSYTKGLWGMLAIEDSLKSLSEQRRNYLLNHKYVLTRPWINFKVYDWQLILNNNSLHSSSSSGEIITNMLPSVYLRRIVKISSI